jgi:HD-like signal output (HDOD) protein
MLLWYVIAGSLPVAIATTFVLLRFVVRTQAVPGGEVRAPRSSADEASCDAAPARAAFRTDAITAAQRELYKLTFSVTSIDSEIPGEHQRVLTAIEGEIETVASQSAYFPRKPALLPKLLRAINTASSGRNEIVRLLLQDAVLAGNVLKRANSVYYNRSKNIVESIDRAVTILGNEGLRAPVASAVMQPVFQLQAGFFESFPPVTWELARRTAAAAEQFARAQRSVDAFVAHLASMLESLGRIVLFRLTMDKYRERGELMPRVEVFVRVMQEHSHRVARAIAGAWEMSPQFLDALDAQVQQAAPEMMSPLARTLYFSNLCGTLATLHKHDLLAVDHACEIIVAQGVSADRFDVLWKAATEADDSQR